MSEWKDTVLSEIVELIGGGTPKTTIPEYWDGDIPWLSVADFNTGKKYVSDTDKKISNTGLKNSSTQLLNKNDLIISARGTVGVVAVLKRSMAFNQSCYGVRALPGKSTNDYIYYLLKDTLSSFLQISHGGVFDTITRDTFNEIEISLPSLTEQKAIASVLSSLDDKIDLLHRQNVTLEKIAETQFRQWFVEEAKEDWEVGVLGDIVEFNYGKTLREQERTGAGYPVYGSSGIVGFHRDYLVKGPGIITGRKGTLGVINYSFENFYPIDTAFYITSKRKSHGLFFEYLLLKELNLNEMNSDSAVPGLNRNLAHSIQITIPPSILVNNFNSLVEPIFSKINTNQIQIRTLTTLQYTILPKLMSGEVRVELY